MTSRGQTGAASWIWLSPLYPAYAHFLLIITRWLGFVVASVYDMIENTAEGRRREW